jgi:hypothetical protein
VLGIVTAEVTELMVLMPYAALNAVACADLLAAGLAAANLEQEHEGLSEDDLLGDEIDEHYGEGVDVNAVGGGLDNSATADVLGAGGAVGGGAADGNNGGATVECDVPQPIRDDKVNNGDRRAANAAGRATLRAETAEIDFEEPLFQCTPGSDEDDEDESSGDDDLQPLSTSAVDSNQRMWAQPDP